MTALEKEFYSRKELAELLGVTPLTVYRITQRGELDYHMIGSAMRFRRDDIEAYLTMRRNVGMGPRKKTTSKKVKSKK